MKLSPTVFSVILGFVLMTIPVIFNSCSKDELYNIEGTVLDITGNPVVNAKIQIFKNTDDWLMGKNNLATMNSDLLGEFKSSKIFEEGDYYIFVEKNDTSNWNINNIEQGVYPIISVPLENRTIQSIEPSNIRLLANTSWKISNTLEEYHKNGSSSSEWKSNWTVYNNCEKDNLLHFSKDLTMRIDEGQTLCQNIPKEINGTFAPPIIFTSQDCEQLLHSSQSVKPFEYEGWDELKELNGEMLISCNQSLGYLYILYDISPSKKGLKVYIKED